MAKQKQKEEVKALATKPKGTALAVLEDKPAFLARRDGKAARGLENLEQSDLTLPRLSLCQSGSPQRKKGNAKEIKGLEEGDFFNSITGTIYGSEVLFVPFFNYKSRIKFVPFEDGGGIDCQSFNAKTGGKHCAKCDDCAFAKFQDDDPPECDILYNYPGFVLHKGKREVAVMSLKSTGVKVAKQFNSLMSLREGADAFAGVYKISSAGASAKGNDYQAVQIANAGWADEDTFNAAEGQYNALKGKKIEVDDVADGKTKSSGKLRDGDDEDI